MDIPFLLYMLEEEGELDTPLGKRNKLIKDLRLRAQWSPIDESDVVERAAAAGFGTLSDEEINDILNEVGVPIAPFGVRKVKNLQGHSYYFYI